MVYQHVGPPVASVTLNAHQFPVAIAKQLFVAGWNESYTEIMHLLSALGIYRECAYRKELDPQAATVEHVMHFVHSHPKPISRATHNSSNLYNTEKRVNDLCILLLDYIEFFDGIDFYDKPATDS